jgi:predicted Zn-dependent protease with MMP-like domain
VVLLLQVSKGIERCQVPELSDEQRMRFDELVEEVIASFPEELAKLVEQIPIIVEDYPSAEMLAECLNEDGSVPGRDEICGMHSGVANTEQSVEDSGMPPSDIYLFREGIIASAGGWEENLEWTEENSDGCGPGGEDEIYEQILVTLLHEIGHQYGLDEDDLARLGFD